MILIYKKIEKEPEINAFELGWAQKYLKFN